MMYFGPVAFIYNKSIVLYCIVVQKIIILSAVPKLMVKQDGLSKWKSLGTNRSNIADGEILQRDWCQVCRLVYFYTDWNSTDQFEY